MKHRMKQLQKAVVTAGHCIVVNKVKSNQVNLNYSANNKHHTMSFWDNCAVYLAA